MLINKKSKAIAFVLAGFFIAGMLVGAAYSWLRSDGAASAKYNPVRLTEDLSFDQVQEGRLQCRVLQDNAPMYSEPSALSGRVIEYMSAGVCVDYLETASSMDKDERYAVTAVEMHFQRLWGRRHIIPQGTPVLILRREDGEVKGRVFVDGKNYEKVFAEENLRFPYLGQWKKVEFNGRQGYMTFRSLSENELR